MPFSTAFAGVLGIRGLATRSCRPESTLHGRSDRWSGVIKMVPGYEVAAIRWQEWTDWRGRMCGSLGLPHLLALSKPFCARIAEVSPLLEIVRSRIEMWVPQRGSHHRWELSSLMSRDQIPLLLLNPCQTCRYVVDYRNCRRMDHSGCVPSGVARPCYQSRRVGRQRRPRGERVRSAQVGRNSCTGDVKPWPRVSNGRFVLCVAVGVAPPNRCVIHRAFETSNPMSGNVTRVIYRSSHPQKRWECLPHSTSAA